MDLRGAADGFGAGLTEANSAYPSSRDEPSEVRAGLLDGDGPVDEGARERVEKTFPSRARRIFSSDRRAPLRSPCGARYLSATFVTLLTESTTRSASSGCPVEYRFSNSSPAIVPSGIP